jgi:hypothetical protein
MSDLESVLSIHEILQVLRSIVLSVYHRLAILNQVPWAQIPAVAIEARGAGHQRRTPSPSRSVPLDSAAQATPFEFVDPFLPFVHRAEDSFFWGKLPLSVGSSSAFPAARKEP